MGFSNSENIASLIVCGDSQNLDASLTKKKRNSEYFNDSFLGR